MADFDGLIMDVLDTRKAGFAGGIVAVTLRPGFAVVGRLVERMIEGACFVERMIEGACFVVEGMIVVVCFVVEGMIEGAGFVDRMVEEACFVVGNMAGRVAVGGIGPVAGGTNLVAGGTNIVAG